MVMTLLLDHGLAIMPCVTLGNLWPSLRERRVNLKTSLFPWLFMLFLVMKMGREVELQLSASRMLLDNVLGFQKARLIEHTFFCWLPRFLVLTKSTPGIFLY
ncbi:hypothetical protein CsSME_00000141 [Camellia sinensis var. sinensis]